MKWKTAILIGVPIAVAATAAINLSRGMAEKSAALTTEISEKAAQTVESKISTIKAANPSKHGSVEVSDTELTSYVLFVLRKNMPVTLNAIDVHLTPGTIGADAKLAFAASDSMFGGEHRLSVKGRMSGKGGRGKFDLTDVRLDGIPVPSILVETLIERYARPKYPEVNLDDPFDLPWGIDSIDIGQGKANIRY